LGGGGGGPFHWTVGGPRGPPPPAGFRTTDLRKKGGGFQSPPPSIGYVFSKKKQGLTLLRGNWGWSGPANIPPVHVREGGLGPGAVRLYISRKNRAGRGRAPNPWKKKTGPLRAFLGPRGSGRPNFLGRIAPLLPPGKAGGGDVGGRLLRGGGGGGGERGDGRLGGQTGAPGDGGLKNKKKKTLGRGGNGRGDGRGISGCKVLEWRSTQGGTTAAGFFSQNFNSFPKARGGGGGRGGRVGGFR